MTISELIQNRQSTRKYKSTEVEKEKIDACLEAARIAPSACNAQAWKFIVVDEPELKNKVAETATSLGMNKFTQQAPIIITVVLEKANSSATIGGRIKNKDYRWIDIGIAVEHICLQATELGLGTCIIGWFNEKKIRKLLGIPRSKRIPLIITLGYPDDEQRTKIRKSIQEISAFNHYKD